MKLLQLSVLGALLSIAATAQAAPQYSVSLLGPVNQHPFTFAQTINNAVVTGYSFTDIPGQDYASSATIWNNGVATTLTGHLSPNSMALSSNLKGQTVGLSWTNMPVVEQIPVPGFTYPAYDGHATLWSQGSASVLPGLYNSYGYASSINNHGQVVGWSLQGNKDKVATLWNNNTPTALGTLAGYTLEAHAINDQGIVVGTATGNGYKTSAVYWNSENQAQLLIGINDDFAGAYAINQSGVISGWSMSASYQQHATIWVDGVAIDLGLLGGYSSFAYGLNNHGDVVGSYLDTSDGGYQEYAVLWKNGIGINLNTLLNPADGLTLTYAQGINDAGYIIAQGYTSAGWGTYLLAPVPEPSSYALMLAGLGLISLSRRKQ